MSSHRILTVALALLVLNAAIPSVAIAAVAASTETGEDQIRLTGGESTIRTDGVEPISRSTQDTSPNKSGSKLSSAVTRLLDRNNDTSDTADPSLITRSTGGPFVTVRVAAPPGYVDEAVDRAGSYDGTVRMRAGDRFIARIPANALRGFAKSPVISFVDTPTELTTAGSITSEGVESVSAPAAHTYGVTGEGVEVAVIDTGFDASNPEIKDNVVSYQAFDGDGKAWRNQSGQHGTATAEIVVDTAPNASLHLYRVKYELDLLNAIRDIDENTSVDVVSMSLGLNNGPFDGTSALDDAIANSVASGTTWFVSAGNAGGGKHYNVTWADANANGLLNFSGTDETLGIAHSTSAPLSITVSWDDYENRNEDYDIALFDAATDELLATSKNSQTGPLTAPSEETITLAAGATTSDMYLVVRQSDANGTSDFDVFVDDYSTLEHWTNTRSISRPATEETVLTVGAVRYSDLSVRSYSSRGPTINGDRKPELMGPDGVSSSVYGPASTGGFTGTSAATPHVAGVAALISQVDSDATPEELRSVLTSTTDGITGTEPDNTAGYGLVNASAALEVATADDGTSPSIADAVAIDASRDTEIGDTKSVVADGDTVRISATVTDANPVVVTTDASPLGGPSSLSLTDEGNDDVYAGVFTVDATGAGAADGAYVFDVTATDVADNTNTVSTTTLTLDTTAPALTDVSAVSDNPIDPAFVGTDGTLTVSANVSDATAVTGTVDLATVGGETNESLVDTDGNGEFTATGVIDHAVTEGTMSFPVTVTDAAGNRNNATTDRITVDHTDPTLSDVAFVNATDGTALLTEGDDAEVRATANDTHLGAVKVDLSQFGGPSSVLLSDGEGDGVYTTTSTITSFNGSARVDVTAVDAAGNEASERSSELLVGAADDTIAPVVLNPEATDLTDGDGEVGENNQVRLAVTVTDDMLVGAVESNASAFGGGTVTLTDDDGDGVYDGTFIVGGEGTLAPNGSHAIGFTALDATRNANTTTTNLTISTSSRTPDAPPLLSNSSLVDETDGNGVVADGDTLTATVDVVDYDLDTVTVDAGAFGVGTVTLTDTDGDGTYSSTFTVDDANVGADGDHAVTVTAFDVLGNTNTTTTEAVTLDTTAPTADAGSDLTATAGQSVPFDGSGSHDATGIAEYAWTFGDSPSASGATPSHTYSEAGNYTATVTVTDAAGNTANDSLNVTVEAAAPPPTAGTGGGGSSGGSSGGRSGGSTGSSVVSSPPSTPEPTPEPVEPEPEVTVSGNASAAVERTDTGISIDITDATSTDRVTIDLPTEDVTERLATDGVALESMSTAFARETGFSADVSSSPTAPADGTPPLDHAVGYLTVDTAEDFAEADVSEVRFGFAISTERLRERDVTLDDVVLFRYHDGEWTALETRLVGTSSTTARFGAVSPGLSTFAIGSQDSLATAGNETEGGTTDTERVSDRNGTNSGDVTATPTVTGESTSSTTSTTGVGFGELSATLAFLVIVVAARRRTRRR